MSKTVELSTVKNGETFKVADIEFIKFGEENGRVIAVAKNCIFDSKFGDNNNLTESKILSNLEKEFLPKIIAEIGEDNILEFETDLTTLDGLKPYENMKSKVSLPTLDFYRQNVEIFDKYKCDEWWWLATPESSQPHDNPYWILCVSPSGFIINWSSYGSISGVRPFLHFVSSIFVSCEN
jgi:hypothetical protein